MFKIDQISRNLIQISWTAMPLPPLERDRVGLLNQMQLSLLCIGTSIGLNFHMLSFDVAPHMYCIIVTTTAVIVCIGQNISLLWPEVIIIGFK